MACKAPNKLADGTEVACRECPQCQLKAKNDWIGRNIAESKTSKFCYWITGTYGRGRVGESLHERAVILTYSDCQKFLKLLRRHGYECRYFITGEYGSDKGRAHWNIIVYSNKPLPPWSGWDQYGRWVGKARLKQHFNWVRCDDSGKPVYLQDGRPAYWWPHGFVHIDEVNVKSLRYVCKYVLKDFDGNGRQGHKGQSKDPPLGTEWFRQLAQRYVEQGLAPQSPAYRFPEARTREGVVIDFWLKGRPLEMFLQHYIDKWRERHGDRPRPRSEFVDLYEKYGRVVNDEGRMLLREEFPRGESRQPIPSAVAMKKVAANLPYERAVRDYETGLSRWYDNWIEEGSNVEERQKRRAVATDERNKEWCAFQHSWGRHWYAGRGWQHRAPTSAQPCGCCDSVPADRPNEGGGASPPVGSGNGADKHALGPVGRYNRDYGPGTGSGPRGDGAPA